jgi:hypothetical protein
MKPAPIKAKRTIAFFPSEIDGIDSDLWHAGLRIGITDGTTRRDRTQRQKYHRQPSAQEEVW